MTHCIASLSLFLVLLVPLHARAEFTPPHMTLPGSGVKAHYVHFHGDRQVEAMTRKLDESLVQALQCSNWPAVRPKESAVVDRYIYSTQDRSVVVIHTELYQVGNDCKPHKISDKTESHIGTAGSYCTLLHNSKIASGPCDLNAPARWDIDKAAPVSTGQGTRQVNGLQCTVYASNIFKGIDGGVCIADGGSFRAFPSEYNPIRVRGIPVEMDFNNQPNSELKEVKFDMDVNSALFTIPKDFTIKSGLTSGKKK